ncbi:MAG: HEAT repeat domain-containing protein [Leptolyngbya sp. SIO1D8]|nr:HEAT repeat domain-containing protein [Leptolyngbya sp. SIO1D8]
MSIDALFEQLKHPNPHLRDRAMWELAETEDETIIPRLMDALDEEDTTYRRAAVKTLGAVGPQTIPYLVETMLNSDNVTARGSAVKALAQVAICYPEVPFSDEGMQGLTQALEDPNPVVNIAAVMTLGQIGSPDAFDILSQAFKTTDNVALSVTIANTFGSIQDSRSSEALKAIIDDESVDNYVRESAVSALSRLELVMKNQPPSQA